MRGVSSAATLLFKESLHLPSIVLPDPVSIVQIPIGIIFVCESKISRTRVPQMGYKTGMPDSLSVYDVSGFVEGVVLIPPAERSEEHTSELQSLSLHDALPISSSRSRFISRALFFLTRYRLYRSRLA